MAVSTVPHATATMISAASVGLAMRLRGLCRVNAGSVFMWVSPQIHPDGPANRKHQRDDLRHRECAQQETIILGTHKLDDKALNSCQHAVKAEQPPFRVLVIAEAPQNEKHHEAECDFVELSREP